MPRSSPPHARLFRAQTASHLTDIQPSTSKSKDRQSPTADPRYLLLQRSPPTYPHRRCQPPKLRLPTMPCPSLHARPPPSPSSPSSDRPRPRTTAPFARSIPPPLPDSRPFCAQAATFDAASTTCSKFGDPPVGSSTSACGTHDRTPSFLLCSLRPPDPTASRFRAAAIWASPEACTPDASLSDIAGAMPMLGPLCSCSSYATEPCRPYIVPPPTCSATHARVIERPPSIGDRPHRASSSPSSSLAHPGPCRASPVPPCPLPCHDPFVPPLVNRGVPRITVLHAF